MEEVVSTRRQAQGIFDKEYLQAADRLAEWWSSAGELPKALALSKKVVDSGRRRYGDEDKDTLIHLSHLALFLWRSGDRVAARNTSKQACAGLIAIAGPRVSRHRRGPRESSDLSARGRELRGGGCS